MTSQQTKSVAFDDAIAAIPSCALDEAGIRDQRRRYADLAPSVTNLEREAKAVLVEFRDGFDRDLLEQALDVERACCPFFQFHFNEARRRLSVTVREPDQVPALDVIAHALGEAHRAFEG